VNSLGRHIAQRLLFGVGFFFSMFGVLMLIGLSRSPEGFRPAPVIGLVILGAVIMVVSARWQRQSIAEA
jgi:hypothetical protein